jgi:hypothetical protein
MARENKGDWRKSSYSGGSTSSSCIEVNWRKSTHSSGNPTGDCVEVAFVASEVGVRDSKNTDGPTLAFPTTTWRTFVTMGEC